MKYIIISTEEDIILPKEWINKNNQELVSAFSEYIKWDNPTSLVQIEEINNDNIVIIAIQNYYDSKFILSILKYRNISENQIIDFYRIWDASYPIFSADRIMHDPTISSYDGIILGLSHSEKGIISDYLSLRTANLSIGSQDIFYNAWKFDYVVKKYPNKLKNLKYLLVDCYDYCYFNYDTSLKHYPTPYYFWDNQIYEKHHFDENKNINMSFSDLKKILWARHLSETTLEQGELFEKLFSSDVDFWKHEKCQCFSLKDYLTQTNICTDKEEITKFSNDLITKMLHKRHPDTIKENIICFRRMLLQAKSLYPNIHIILIQMPIHPEAQKIIGLEEIQWKDDFFQCLEQVTQGLTVDYLDFREHPIANRPELFQDSDHLNYYGAALFTQIINNYIVNIVDGDV